MYWQIKLTAHQHHQVSNTSFNSVQLQGPLACRIVLNLEWDDGEVATTIPAAPAESLLNLKQLRGTQISSSPMKKLSSMANTENTQVWLSTAYYVAVGNFPFMVDVSWVWCAFPSSQSHKQPFSTANIPKLLPFSVQVGLHCCIQSKSTWLTLTL